MVSMQSRDGIGNGTHIVRRNQYAIDAIFYDRRNRSHISGYGNASEAHTFQQAHRQAFKIRWKYEDICMLQKGIFCVVVHNATVIKSFAEVSCKSWDIFAYILFATCQRYIKGNSSGSQTSACLQQFRHTFSLSNTSKVTYSQ